MLIVQRSRAVVSASLRHLNEVLLKSRSLKVSGLQQRSVGFFQDVGGSAVFARPSARIDPTKLEPDPKWPSQYVKKLVFKIHPDLFHAAKVPDHVAPTNSESLSRLNNIVDFLEMISNTMATIPAGGMPSAQTITLFTLDAKSASADQHSSVRKVELKFEIPSTTPDKLVQMSRGYCNQFLLKLMRCMQIQLPESTSQYVEFHAQMDCHRAAPANLSQMASPSSAAAVPNMSDFRSTIDNTTSFQDEDIEAATLGAVFGPVVTTVKKNGPTSTTFGVDIGPEHSSPSPSASSAQSPKGRAGTSATAAGIFAAGSGSSAGTTASDETVESFTAAYRRSKTQADINTTLMRSLEAHRDLCSDLLFAVEMERDRGSIDKLVRRMLNSDLIFFARELDQRQINIALQNFSSLLRLHWYELNVKSWFGLPIMFAKDYSTHRAPGFIVLPYRWRTSEAVDFILTRAVQIKSGEEPLESSAFSSDEEFGREHGLSEAEWKRMAHGIFGEAKSSSLASSKRKSKTGTDAQQNDFMASLFADGLMPNSKASSLAEDDASKEKKAEDDFVASRVAAFASAATSQSKSSSAVTLKRSFKSSSVILPRTRRAGSERDALNAVAAAAHNFEADPTGEKAAQSEKDEDDEVNDPDAIDLTFSAKFRSSPNRKSSSSSSSSSLRPAPPSSPSQPSSSGVDWAQAIAAGARGQSPISPFPSVAVPKPSSVPRHLRKYAATNSIFKF